MRDLNYVELFAGCGGLSLGLESEDWNLRLANELSPMAAETFAYNHLGFDTSADVKGVSPVWSVSDLGAIDEKKFSRVKLVVGDVVELVDLLSEKEKLLGSLEGVDLISGGPPCQGFSMAGRRIERDAKNKLPYAFVDLVELLQPRLVILENVEGITRAFKSDGGDRLPWLEVAKAFAQVGYAPVCFLLNAKYFGVPQNRPRFVLIGMRKDQKVRILGKLKFASDEARKVYSSAFEFVDGDQNDLKLVEMGGDEDSIAVRFVTQNLFPEAKFPLVSVRDAIDDLKTRGLKGKGVVASVDSNSCSAYVNDLNEAFSERLNVSMRSSEGLTNHELRAHSDRIRLRFRLSQIGSTIEDELKLEFAQVLAGRMLPSAQLLNVLWRGLKKNGAKVHEALDLRTKEELGEFLPKLRSKKQIQRALQKDSPAPAQVTIPDDLCHYHPGQPRVLTVREMARIQSFPDGFVFRSKVTTGGVNRKSEVPQYTQVGNAVPPLLGKALGALAKRLLL